MENVQKRPKGLIVAVVAGALCVCVVGIYFMQTEQGIKVASASMPSVTSGSTQASAVVTPATVSTVTATTTSAAPGMTSYADAQLGISFEYPSNWGTPTKTVANDPEGQVTISFANSGFDIFYTPIPFKFFNPTAGVEMAFVTPASAYQTYATTAAAYIQKEQTNWSGQSKQIQLAGQGAVYMSDVTRPDAVSVLLPDLEGNVIEIDGSMGSPADNVLDYQAFLNVLDSFKVFAAAPAPQTQGGLKTYAESSLGLSFQYPASLNSDWAELDSVSVFSDNKDVNASGCYIPWIFRGGSKISQGTPVTLNGIPFCTVSSGDPGAGSDIQTYDYTTKRNGAYITLEYEVGMPNGCGARSGSEGQSCHDFFDKQFDSVVTQPIQESAGTLQFSN